VRERRRERLARLADWTASDTPDQSGPVLTKTLAHAASVFEVPRVLVIWEENEEPFVNVVLWHNGKYDRQREPAGTLENLVHPQYESSAFLVSSATSHFAILKAGPRRVNPPLVDAALIDRFQMGSAGTAPFAGTSCRGRVFVLDRFIWSDDH